VQVASESCPQADLKLYVDDPIIDAPGAHDVAASVVARIVTFVVRHLEVHLELEVSATKSTAVGSDTATARSLCARVANRKLCPKRVSKMYGAPCGVADASCLRRGTRVCPLRRIVAPLAFPPSPMAGTLRRR